MVETKKIIIDYINKYGTLFENDALILLDDVKTTKKIEKIKKDFKQKKEKLKDEHESKIEKLKDFAKDTGEDYAKDTLDELMEKIKIRTRTIRNTYFTRLAALGKKELGSIQKVKTISGKQVLLISGLSLAALILHTGYQVYRDETKNINMKCNSKKGLARELCFKKYRIRALERRIVFLSNAAVKCNYSKHPVKCRAKLNEEILKLREKLADETVAFGKKIRIEL